MLTALLCTGNIQEPDHFSHAIWRGLVELADGDVNMVHQLNPSVIRPDELEHYDLIVSNSLGRGRMDECKQELEGKIPWVVYDLGYIDRYSELNTKGYLQLGLGKTGWIPEFSVNNKRRLIEYKSATIKKAAITMIIAQLPGDPAHGMSEADMKRWVDNCIVKIRHKDPTSAIWLRNHPLNPHPYRPDKVVLRDDKPLEHWLPLVGSVMTYNSTAGIAAIAQGVVVYSDSSAVYGEISNRLGDYGSPKQIDTLLGNDFFSRVGYAQWTHKELGTGLPFKDLVDIYNNQIPAEWIDNPDQPENSIGQVEYDTAKQVKHEKKFFVARSIAKQQWPDQVFHNQQELTDFVEKKIYDFNQQVIKRV